MITAQPDIRHKIYVVNNFGYICVGIKKFYAAHLFPTIIIVKMLIKKLSSYLKAQYKVYVRCFFHIIFRRISFKSHVQHRYVL